MSGIAIVDLGTGNLRSVARALAHEVAGDPPAITRDPAVIGRAARVVLPGQGAIGTWMSALADAGLRRAVDAALAGRPVLGICLGLEALYGFSDEDGGVPCLGLLAGRVRRFTGADPGARKVPHMGWNRVRQSRPHPLWRGIEDGARFYFVHSYYAAAECDDEVFGRTDYGLTFTSAAGRGNFFAVQFHPEKSRTAGLRLLRNFSAWDGGC